MLIEKSDNAMFSFSDEALHNLSFPCYKLSEGGEYLLNNAAATAEPMLEISAAVLAVLESMLLKTEKNAPPQLRPVSSRKVTAQYLVFIKPENNAIAFLVEKNFPFSDVYSENMRFSISNIFAILPMLSIRLDGQDVRYLEEIQKNCYVMLRSTNNLELVQRMQQKKIVSKTIDIVEMLSVLCESVRILSNEKDMPVELSVPKTPIFIRGDENAIAESIMNILRNSFMYTRDNNQINIKVSQKGDRAMVIIRDRGIGIKEEYVEQVFDLHFSVDPYGDTQERPGLGVGLYTVKEAILAIGGSIAIQSRFGEGTTISIAFPVDTSPADKLQSQSADYLLNRFSSVYIHFGDVLRSPGM